VALLLPAVLQRQREQWEPVSNFHAALVSVVKIVTSFTLAHSLTRGAAVLDVITPPARLVESLIAISVMVAALNNLFRIIPARYLVGLTFVFGLIHGFGFASVLQELGLPHEALLLSLLGFNLGVELGQMAIVGMVLPLAYALRHSVAVSSRGAAVRLVGNRGHRLAIVLIFVGAAWVFFQAGKRAWPLSRRGRMASRHLVRYGALGAIGLIMLGLGMAFSAVRQAARRMAMAAEVSEQLAEPLRHRLRIAELRDIAYQTQPVALREAITYLAHQSPMRQTPQRVSGVLAQLGTMQTALFGAAGSPAGAAQVQTWLEHLKAPLQEQ
jgi:hypothetical protein